MRFQQQLAQQLWQDCDEIYLKHQHLCIQLQDKYLLDVNLLLLAIWLDKQRHSLTKQQWQTLQSSTLKWNQQRLLPHRNLRRASKANLTADEYQRMLDLELMLERKSQHVILRSITPLTWQHGASNLKHYLSLFNLNNQDYSILTQ